MRDNSQMSIGTRVRAARKKVGLSQAALAAKIGVAQPTLSQLENDVSTGTAFIGSIANVLGVSSLWLETGKGLMAPSLNLTAKELFIITTYRSASEKGIAMIDAACNFASDLPTDLDPS